MDEAWVCSTLATGEIRYEMGRSRPPKPNFYDEVTAQIIAGLGLPKNALTGRDYSGVNILILWHRGAPSYGSL